VGLGIRYGQASRVHAWRKGIDVAYPKFAANLPWYMFDLSSQQLITSAQIPEGGIKDSKAVIMTETPIPGLNMQPVSFGGNGNRKIAFKLPILARGSDLGNIALIKQFEVLRNQRRGIMGLYPQGQFVPNPKVLYSWGIGSVPLVYYVTKLEFEHRADMVNRAGAPTYTMVDIELTLDETGWLYKAEETFRAAMLMFGIAEGAVSTAFPGRL